MKKPDYFLPNHSFIESRTKKSKTLRKSLLSLAAISSVCIIVGIFFGKFWTLRTGQDLFRVSRQLATEDEQVDEQSNPSLASKTLENETKRQVPQVIEKTAGEVTSEVPTTANRSTPNPLPTDNSILPDLPALTNLSSLKSKITLPHSNSEDAPFVIQLASFAFDSDAKKEMKTYLKLDVPVWIKPIDTPNSGKRYRIYAGSFMSRKEADEFKQQKRLSKGIVFSRKAIEHH